MASGSLDFMASPPLRLKTSFSDLSGSESTDLTTPSPSTSTTDATVASPPPFLGVNGYLPGSIIRLSRKVLDRFGNVVEFGTLATRKLTGSTYDLSTEGPLTRAKNSAGQGRKGSWVTDSLNSFDASRSTETLLDELDDAQDIEVPVSLQQGIQLLRVTRRKKTTKTFCIDPQSGFVTWDSKLAKKIRVDKIGEIRLGEDARTYQQRLNVSSDHSTRWATIIYYTESNKLKQLHIVGLDQSQFDLFICTLKALVKHRQDMMAGLAIAGARFVKVHWSRLPKDGKDRLTFDGIEQLSRKLHINCSKSYLLEKFNECDVDNSGSLDFEEFKMFVRVMKRRPEAVTVFESHAEIMRDNGQLYMTIDGFERFVSQVQKQEMPRQELELAFNTYAQDGYLSAESFTDLLISDFFPPLKLVPEDLTRPLNEYFISSSHNTYLMGRQVAGASSVEAYIRALQKGCRCIEIDCWDGDNGPTVRHGRAFTTSIDFTDVIKTIRKYGFISSPFPLILSLEVHCNPENQSRMVSILKSVLGEQLLTEPLVKGYFMLPSPEVLKHRILIKVKNDACSFSHIDKESEHNSLTDTFVSTASSSSNMSEDETSTAQQRDGRKRSRAGKPQAKIVPDLAALGVYCTGLKFRNFGLPVSKTVNHIFSLSERAANAMIRDTTKSSQMEKHNRRYLMRIYPSAYRVTSKNFDPIQYWKKGVQMVAMNWQTNDIGYQISEAMFSDAHVGYILKPPSLLSPGVLKLNQWMKRHCSRGPKPAQVRISFDIISAQQLPRPRGVRDDRFQPYVTVEVFGGNASTTSALSPVSTTNLNGSSSSLMKRTDTLSTVAMKKFKTSAADNGFNPVWGEQWGFTVDPKDVPFLFVRFAVHSGDRENAFAVYTVRLCYLQQGYRHLPLNDLQGEEYIFSSLFIKSDLDGVIA